LAIEQALEARKWAGLDVCEAPLGTKAQIARVHDSAHIDAIESFCASGGGMIDMDTVVSEGSWAATLRATGAACEAVERLLGGATHSAFCALRPPGHHAERDRAMGFCLFNTIAVAAEHAIVNGGAERVLILDWDVHHGNGTEAIFKASDRVLYSSIHEWPLYPGTGAADYVGEGAGEGFTINMPVTAGSGNEEFLALIQHVVAPIAHSYQPDLLAISAGFDAHRADPLASCSVEADGYGRMAAAIRRLGEELKAPILVCLEGGYELTALAESVVATLDGLGSHTDPGRTDPELVARHVDRARRHWPLI